VTTPAPTPQPPESLEDFRERMKDEYRTGLDKVGPQWERVAEENEGSEP
jgi:hypothetical protein